MEILNKNMKKEDFYAPDWKERQAKYKLINYCALCIIQNVQPKKVK